MIGIIDYGAGNVRSVCNALDTLGFSYFVSKDAAELARADKLILPGVGEAQSAMDALGKNGLVAWLRGVKVPFLGICIGMQILFDHSDERATPCLGLIGGRVQRFDDGEVKVPHMGWNRVALQQSDPLFRDVANGAYFYFVHSYYAPVVDATLAVTNYRGDFSAGVRKGNFYGVQFHAEKSGKAGLQVLRNFAELC